MLEKGAIKGEKRFTMPKCVNRRRSHSINRDLSDLSASNLRFQVAILEIGKRLNSVASGLAMRRQAREDMVCPQWQLVICYDGGRNPFREELSVYVNSPIVNTLSIYRSSSI